MIEGEAIIKLKEALADAKIAFLEFEKQILDRVTRIQNDCKHTWVNVGGHDYICDKCSKCGNEEWR